MHIWRTGNAVSLAKENVALWVLICTWYVINAKDTREETVEFASINDGTKGRRYTSALDYDSEGNEVLRQFTEESSDEDTRDKGDLTSNESLNDSYNEDIPVIPQPKSLHVDAPYWYNFGALMVQFPANIIGIRQAHYFSRP